MSLLPGARAAKDGRRFCVPCGVTWRASEACWMCGELGVASEFVDPPGWTKLTDVAARRAVERGDRGT